MRPLIFNFKNSLVYKMFCHSSFQMCDALGRMQIYGYENVPNEPFIIVANHVSLLDPAAMTFFENREHCAMAKEELMNNFISKAFFKNINAIAVKRGQAGNIGAFRDVLNRLKSGKNVLIFPEGTRSDSIQKGKAGAGLIALKSGAPILPVRSFGFDELFPRKNRIECGTRLILRAGKPFRASDIDPGKGSTNRAQDIVDAIMQKISEIEKPATFEV